MVLDVFHTEKMFAFQLLYSRVQTCKNSPGPNGVIQDLNTEKPALKVRSPFKNSIRLGPQVWIFL